MTTNVLQDAIRRQPFVPFVLRTADSREVRVPHPEFIAYGGGRIAVVTTPEDHIEMIDLLLIVSLEYAGGPVHVSQYEG